MSLLQFYRKSPFFRWLVFYVAGLLAARSIELPLGLGMGLILSSVALSIVIAVAFTGSRRIRTGKLFGIVILTVLFAEGLFHASMEKTAQKQVLSLYESKGIFQAVILEQPEVRSRTVRVMARITGEMKGDSLLADHFKAVLYVERDSVAESLAPGTGLIFLGELQRIWLAGNPGEFDYREYLANRRVYLQAYVASNNYQPVRLGRALGLRTMAARIRQRLLSRYRRLNLTSEEWGVLSALTLGYRNDLDGQTKDAFVHAGVMHIMALSGFHVGMIALLLGFVFRLFVGNASGKVIRVSLTLILLWAFSLISGLSTSVIRATLMLSLALPARFFGRKVNIYNMLFASTLVMLTARPGYLSDVGFQLSFLAVAGISLVQPLLQNTARSRFFPADSLRKILIVSFTAQLATLPVTLRCFHQFPVYFWLANLFVIPLAALIIYSSVFYLILGWIKSLGLIIGKVVAASVKGLYYGVSLVKKLPHALPEGIDISDWQALLLLFTLLFFGLFILNRKNILLLAGMTALFGLLAAGTWRDYRQDRQKVLSIHNVSGMTCINLISGRSSILLVHPDSMITQAQLDYSFENYWTGQGVFGNATVLDPYDTVAVARYFSGFPDLYLKSHFMGDNLFLQFHGKSMVVLKEFHETGNPANKPLDVELAVITGTLSFDPEKILKHFTFDLLILDSSLDYYNMQRWCEWCRTAGIKSWNVTEQGAYLLEPGFVY